MEEIQQGQEAEGGRGPGIQWMGESPIEPEMGRSRRRKGQRIENIVAGLSGPEMGDEAKNS